MTIQDKIIVYGAGILAIVMLIGALYQYLSNKKTGEHRTFGLLIFYAAAFIICSMLYLFFMSGVDTVQ